MDKDFLLPAFCAPIEHCFISGFIAIFCGWTNICKYWQMQSFGNLMCSFTSSFLTFHLDAHCTVIDQEC